METKFKVGDVVKIHKPDNVYEHERLSRYGDMDKNDWKIITINKIDDDGDIKHEELYYASDRLTLVNPKEDPQKIAIHCKTEEEAKLLMEAYDRKWWKYTNWKMASHDNFLLEFPYYAMEDMFDCYDNGEVIENWYKVVSFQEWMKLLGEDIKPELPKFIPVTATEAYLRWIRPSRIGIDEAVDMPKVTYSFTHWLQTTTNCPNTPTIQPFNPLQTPKMSTLRTNIFDRFFKKEESKLADLIEEVEEWFEPVIDLYNWLDEITDKQEDLVKYLDNAVERKDKSAIKEAKKELEKFKKETLEDKIFDQLITIGSKLRLTKHTYSYWVGLY